MSVANGFPVRRPSVKWSRIWHEDAPEGTLARHEGRLVVRRGEHWIDVETGEEISV